MSDLPIPEAEEIVDPNETEGVRSLREANKRLTAEASAGQVAVRKLAFIEAGLDPSNPQHQLLIKAYDGELTTDAIIEEATKYGLIGPGVTPPATPEAPPVAPPQSQFDQSQTQARQGLGAESIDPGTPPAQGDPMESAYAEFHKLKRDGATSEEASSAVFGAIFEQARANPAGGFVFNAQDWQSSEKATSR
jgi:hypothetical protein